MLIRLSLLLIVVPLLEVVLLLGIADLTGFSTTLAIVIVTGISGAWLLRRQGLKSLRNIRAELSGGRLPPTELLDGVLILMAGVLLLTPGVLTDLLGIALLIPWTRSVIRRWLIDYFKSRWQLLRSSNSSASSTDRHAEVIDSYVVSPTKEQNG